MEEEPIWMDFEKNDFLIVLTPTINKDNRWLGEMSISHSTTNYNDMHEEDKDNMIRMIEMLVAAIPLMEEDLEFREKLYNYTSNMVQPKEKPKIIGKKNNVISINFN